jgi:predicted nuclease of predicted toxin-antitoxin system
MKLLIDECLPRTLKRLFEDHECRTVQEMGWSGKKNGVLLSLAELEFDVLVTVDQGMEYEQNLANRKMAVLVLAARSNQIEDLEPIIPAALAALRSIHPGRAIRVGAK